MHNRREFLRRGLGAACGLAAARASVGEGVPRARPNIVVLFTDDQRFDTVHALGSAEIQTPNLDRLVARGTAFTHATVMGGLHGAICVPSRAMLHTGRHLFHLGGTGDILPPEYSSLPETLRAAGYRTYATGKWHNDKASFNRFYNEGGPIFWGGMNSHINAPIYDYDATGAYPKDAARSTGDAQDGTVYTDAAVRFIEGEHTAPFFLYIAHTMPHDPRTPPESFLDLYDPAKLTLPKNFLPAHPFDNGELVVRDELLAPFPRTEESIRRHLADYYASISFVDEQVGRVLDTLDARGFAENTIVVFAGDNGLAVGQHGLMGKQSLYDHSIRVPFLFAGPGIATGARRAAPCYTSDLFPTICDLTGIAIPPTVETRSLANALRDENARPYETTFHAYRDLHRAVRGERYKLIEYYIGETRRTQLFDLQEDPWEMNDLSADRPSEIEALREQLRVWRDRAEFSPA